MTLWHLILIAGLAAIWFSGGGLVLWLARRNP